MESQQGHAEMFGEITAEIQSPSVEMCTDSLFLVWSNLTEDIYAVYHLGFLFMVGTKVPGPSEF